MRHTGRGLAEAPDVVAGKVDAVRAPDVAVEPAEPLEVLDRPAVIQLEAVRLLLGGFGEVGVEAQTEAPRQLCRLGHQASRDRERRARRDDQLGVARGEPLGVRQHLVWLLDHGIRRQPAV